MNIYIYNISIYEYFLYRKSTLYNQFTLLFVETNEETLLEEPVSVAEDTPEEPIASNSTFNYVSK